MTIVFKPEMAEILGLTEAEFAALEAEDMPGVSTEEHPGGVIVKRYNTALIWRWCVRRHVRRCLAH